MLSIRVLGLALVGGAAVVSGPLQKPSLHVCVGPDKVLRHEAGSRCPAGTASYDLALDAELPEEPKEEEKALQQQVDELKRKLDFMNTRMLELQRALADASRARAGGKVMAPFEVVNEQGKALLSVYSKPGIGTTLSLSTGSGEPVLWASALQGGGVFKTRSSGAFPEVVMGSSGSFGGLTIRDGEDLSRVALMLTDGKPSLNMSNDNHVGIVSIMQGATGGGFLQLGVASGEAGVQAGTTSGNCGKVETFPPRQAKMMGGVPSFILGHGC